MRPCCSARRPHAQVRQAEGLGDARAHEVAERDARALLAEHRDHPHAGARVVLEARARLPVEAPAREARAQRLAGGPVPGARGRLGEARRVGEELLDADRVLAVRRELGEHVGHALAEAELPLLEEQPRRRRGDRLAAREDHEQGLVRRAAEAAQRGELPVARHGELAVGQHTLAQLALGALEELLELRGVDAEGLGRGSEGVLPGHGGDLEGCVSRESGKAHEAYHAREAPSPRRSAPSAPWRRTGRGAPGTGPARACTSCAGRHADRAGRAPRAGRASAPRRTRTRSRP